VTERRTPFERGLLRLIWGCVIAIVAILLTACATLPYPPMPVGRVTPQHVTDYVDARIAVDRANDARRLAIMRWNVYGSSLADGGTTVLALNSCSACVEGNPVWGNLPRDNEAAFMLASIGVAYLVDRIATKAQRNHERGWWLGPAVYAIIKYGLAANNLRYIE